MEKVITRDERNHNSEGLELAGHAECTVRGNPRPTLEHAGASRANARQ